MIRKIEAIKKLRPNSNFTINEKNIINWLDKKTIVPTDIEIESTIKELEAKAIIEIQQIAFNNAIQTHLDTKAKESRYDNMMSARSYAGYTNPFQAEAKKLAIWASNCWVKAGEIEADVKDGNRDIPTIDEVLKELPIYE